MASGERFVSDAGLGGTHDGTLLTGARQRDTNGGANMLGEAGRTSDANAAQRKAAQLALTDCAAEGPSDNEKQWRVVRSCVTFTARWHT